MPLLRYFVFVGAALLALLFLSDAVLPQVPLPSTLNSGSDLPAVRIHSDRKWPERVVFDTSVPAGAPVMVAKTAAPGQPTLALADISTKARVREAFAQLPPGKFDSKGESKVESKGGSQVETQTSTATIAAMAASQPINASQQPNRPELKPQLKRKVARAHPARPLVLVAQQPHYGLFDTTW